VLHLSLLRGVGQRYRAPFFAALREYSHHAGATVAAPLGLLRRACPCTQNY
jgi:hypothetical protein